MKTIDPVMTLRQMAAKTSQRQVALALGVSPMYLCDVLAGRRKVGPTLLAALGLKREIIYRYRADRR